MLLSSPFNEREIQFLRLKALEMRECLVKTVLIYFVTLTV